MFVVFFFVSLFPTNDSVFCSFSDAQFHRGMWQYMYYLQLCIYNRIRDASSNVIRCWMSFIKYCCNKCCCARSFTGADLWIRIHVFVYVRCNTISLPTHPWDGPFLSGGPSYCPYPYTKPHWLILLVYSFIYINFIYFLVVYCYLLLLFCSSLFHRLIHTELRSNPFSIM